MKATPIAYNVLRERENLRRRRM
uniref:Uncharacterized protein n=1 Tax=Rhizophora mucronata TaxID=61149 RepID=A0A2P2Q358_RHIMU